MFTLSLTEVLFVGGTPPGPAGGGAGIVVLAPEYSVNVNVITVPTSALLPCTPLALTANWI